MELAAIATYDELKDWLLEKMDSFTDEQSVCAKSLTKEQVWNAHIADCIKFKGEPLSIKTSDILKNRLRKDFGL